MNDGDADSGLEAQVLILNQNYEPLNITNAKRAVSLVVLGKAEILESDGELIRSERLSLAFPSVVKLLYFVRRPVPELKISRKNILARDRHTCQYCGRHDGPLTIDHVTPRNRGGETEWSNLVCCCLKCNARKGSKLASEVGMKLVRQPRRPKYVPFINLAKLMTAYEQKKWQPYLFPYVDDSSA